MERVSAQCVAFRMPKQVIMYGANSPNGLLTTAIA